VIRKCASQATILSGPSREKRKGSYEKRHGDTKKSAGYNQKPEGRMTLADKDCGQQMEEMGKKFESSDEREHQGGRRRGVFERRKRRRKKKREWTDRIP